MFSHLGHHTKFQLIPPGVNPIQEQEALVVPPRAIPWFWIVLGLVAIASVIWAILGSRQADVKQDAGLPSHPPMLTATLTPGPSATPSSSPSPSPTRWMPPTLTLISDHVAPAGTAATGVPVVQTVIVPFQVTRVVPWEVTRVVTQIVTQAPIIVVITQVVTATYTSTPTATFTPPPSATPTASATASATPSPTITLTASLSPEPSATGTLEPSATGTPAGMALP